MFETLGSIVRIAVVDYKVLYNLAFVFQWSMLSCPVVV